MGSRTFDGVRFAAWSDDHLPAHVHGSYAGVRVVILLTDGRVKLARRKDRIRPPGAKKADVQHILQTARVHAEELVALWEAARG